MQPMTSDMQAEILRNLPTETLRAEQERVAVRLTELFNKCQVINQILAERAGQDEAAHIG